LITNIAALPAWQEICAGLDQRAQLLELIAADTYQSQSLIRQGLLPPAAVYGHPGYQRPMHGVLSALNQQHLHVIGFHLAQAPDQSWAVVSQFTQAPAGLCHLEDFEGARAMLHGLFLASAVGVTAKAAVLTSGPFNHLYMEHVRLAKQLGVPLVQGFNLVCKNQQLFLKSDQEPMRIDILIKQLDDDFLDPLEFRADSLLGVAGLMQAIRAGQVMVVNAPGAGFLESIELGESLDAISRALLGEPLQLANFKAGDLKANHLAPGAKTANTIAAQHVLAVCHGPKCWKILPAGQVMI